MALSLSEDFQSKVSVLIARNNNILDILTKFQDSSAKTCRSVIKSATGCGCVKINAEKAVLTGNKLIQKKYYHHTGYVGHLKEVNYKTLMAKNPAFAMKLAVKGMLPHNSVGAKSLTRCHIYAGANHKHQAQAPEAWVK